MKNSNKGISPIVIILIASGVLILAGGGWYLYHTNIKSNDKIPIQNPQMVDETANWKIYRNDTYGFSFRYPSNWFIRESSNKTSVDFSKSELVKNDPNGATKIFASFYIGNLYLNEEGRPVRVGTPEEFFNYYYPADEEKHYVPGTSVTREWITISGIPAFYHYVVGNDSRYPFANRYELYTLDKNYSFVLYAGTIQQPTTYEQKDNDLIKQVIGTLSLSDNSAKFIKAGSESQSSTSQTACPEGCPKINSITPSSGPKGTTVQIMGENLSGLEGDLIVTFERSDGQKIILSDPADRGQRKLIKVKVEEPCQKRANYNSRLFGIQKECNYVEFTPGIYKVYTEPWGKKVI